MPEFDLGDGFQAEYQITGVPRLWEKCGVYLAIRDDDDRLSDGSGNPDLPGSPFNPPRNV
jgi:hypothetical protein